MNPSFGRSVPAINTTFVLVALVTSVITAISLQTFDPVPILLLCLIPWPIIVFYRYPLLLVSFWLVLMFATMIFPHERFILGSDQTGIVFLPMDPAYFYSIIYLLLYALTQPEKFKKALKANPFLTIFLAIILVYILTCMPIYGKSALGEPRKAYFFLFFPIVTFLSIRQLNDLRKLLYLIYFLSLVLLTISLVRLITGSYGRALGDSELALFFLFTTLSILSFHMNGNAIVNRATDITVLGLCLLIVILTQHRSVFIAAASGLLMMCVLSRDNRGLMLKMSMALIAFFALIGIVFSFDSAFERRTITALSGIINPSSDNTASWRMQGWSRQLASLSTIELLFGQGFGSYYQAFNALWKKTQAQVHPHNAYIQMISNFGLLGLVIYGLLAFWFFRKIFAVRRKLRHGTMRGYVEMSIINFAGAHGFMMGYGFCLPILIFLGMGMSTMKLLEDCLPVGEQDKVPDT